MLMPASSALAIRLAAADNVVVARVDLAAGTEIPEERVCTARIPRGHKLATLAIESGSPVVKYGQIIGFATRRIEAGEHVHIHNIAMGDFVRDYDFARGATPTDLVAPEEQAYFNGFHRADGRVATRNYLGVLTSVNCSAHVARLIADRFRGDALAAFPQVDGVVALTHGAGCGMQGDGLGMEVLRRTVAGYARHVNFAGVLLIGLGCEANQIAGILQAEGLDRGPKLQTMTIQEEGGSQATVREGVARIEAMLPIANQQRRERAAAHHLILALQCGGSDGYSGITANPALGAAADLLVRHGGTVILSETPEIYGAEHLLTRRAVTPEVGQKIVERIRWWESYAAQGAGMDNNPSPGNKAGGLTTILEKSLGAVAKGGSTNLVEVYRYGETVTARGFVFMDTPGYDPVSATGQVAGGANILCFTTGRGSVFGCKPTPSLKLATNTPLYRRMSEDMDIDCGPIADGLASVEQMGRQIFERLLETASGQRTKSELMGFGEAEFAPWQLGPVM